MISTRRRCVVAASLALALVPCAVSAEPPTSAPVPPAPLAPGELEELRESVERADFQHAEPRLRALLTEPALSAREHALALELSVVIALAARRDAEAQRLLAELYGRDPGHRLSVSELGPQVSAAFERAGRARRELEPTPIAAELVVTGDGRRTLDVRLDDPAQRVDSVHAYLWFDSERLLSHMVAEGTSSARFYVPEPPAEARALELHVEVRAPSGALLGSAGTREAPLALTLAQKPAAVACPEPEETPLRKRWWVWTTLGIVVAGIATGSAIAVH